MRYLIFLFVLIFFSCNDNIKETPGGLKFEVMKKGKGDLAKKNDVVLFHLKLIDSNDSIWINTYEEGLPFVSLTGDPKTVRESPLKQMFRMVHPDDSIVVRLTAEQYFRYAFNQTAPWNISPSMKLSYQVKIDRILPVEGYATWMDILSFRIGKKKIGDRPN